MDLNKKIKQSLIETKEKKENLLIEEKIVKSRLMMIFENQKDIDNFDYLPQKKKDKIVHGFIVEINSLREDELLNEQLDKILGSIFGNLTGNLSQTIAERIINWLLPNFIPQGIFRNTIISLLSSHPIEVIQSIGDCQKFTKLLSKAIVEAFIMKLKEKWGAGGFGSDMIRNTLITSIEQSDWGKSLEDKFSGAVCDLFHKLIGKSENVLNNLNPMSGNAGKTQTSPAVK